MYMTSVLTLYSPSLQKPNSFIHKIADTDKAAVLALSTLIVRAFLLSEQSGVSSMLIYLFHYKVIMKDLHIFAKGLALIVYNKGNGF